MPSVNISPKYIILAVFMLLLPVLLLSRGSFTDTAVMIKYELEDKTGFNISLSSVNPGISALSANPFNELVLKVEIRDAEGMPVQGARFESSIPEGMGELYPSGIRTSADGSCLIRYKPPFLTAESFKNGNTKAAISVTIPGTRKNALMSFGLVRIPVVFVHGYKASPSIFGNFRDYLESMGFRTTAISYDSGSGVASGATELGRYLEKAAAQYLDEGIQVGRFDIIAHSMGGLVARYYTCSSEYAVKNNVDKLIFISVPHTGSLLASLGLKYYSDQGIHDLIPDSSLFTSVFPSMINKGLNSSIQVGNILDQYDEAVGPESASLEEWGIRTEMFNVGESNFTIDKLLSGEIVEATNHKAVLYNMKVFKRVEEMLYSNLPYPVRK